MNRNQLRIVRIICILVLSFSMLGGVVAAGEKELGFQLGLLWPDHDLSGEAAQFDNFEPVMGVRGNWSLNENFGLFLDGWYAQLDAPGVSYDTISGRAGVEFWLTGSSADDKRLFLDVGAGIKKFDDGSNPSVDRSFASLSLGQRIRFRDSSFFRWEIRGDTSLDDDGFGGETFIQPQALVSVGKVFGGQRTDSDGDGVLDRRDKCPDTPRGAIVDARGCPSDTDGDGVHDGLDQCPDTPAGFAVNADGCAKDTDGDGVVDGLDKCPDTPKNAKVDANGCPMDSDKDGVYDGLDKCPNSPKGAKVNADGCPLDSDKDGVFDGLDKCPNTPKGAKVDASGCPLDSDKDGVYDGLDKCPGTPAGTKVSADGCPEKRLFTKERKVFVLKGVNFKTNSAELTGASTTALDEVAATLAEWPEVSIEIGGHTDSQGSDGFNQKLSERRANSVMNYLASKDIDSRRMTKKGYGESQPIADNKTADGRGKNRRVELKKTN